MERSQVSSRNSESRAKEALLNVLPRSAREEVQVGNRPGDLIVGGQELEVKWAGEGNLGDVNDLLARHEHKPDIFMARRFSPGAKARMSEEGIGWIDETGAAEVAIASLIISRSGQPPTPIEWPLRWTPAVLAVGEAILCGNKPTVSEVRLATGLSTGSCVNALRVLAGLGLLEADALRGRQSGRRLGDQDQFLNAYASAVAQIPETPSLTVGAVWRDPIASLVEVGRQWDQSGVLWVSTGAAAASAIAPYMSTVSTIEVYVGAHTVVGLESAARDAGLRPIDGGRLTLRPFPTATTRCLATKVDELWVAPWPRVYVDLCKVGVRGEEAAEHLREVMHGSPT